MASWFLRGVQTRDIVLLSLDTLFILTTFDVIVSGMISAVVVLVGKAIVSYEIFTGKALPRGGLLRDWRNSLILASAYGGFMAASLELSVAPIYHLLLATGLMTVFFALLSWRSYVERENSIKSLRPFVASQRVYENILAQNGPFETNVSAPLRALCDDILGARVAYLTVLGPLTSLVNESYSFPLQKPVPALNDLESELISSKEICVRLNPTESGGAEWAVGLWGERGLLGALLLGKKRDGRLYAQEEIEIARDVGERLIDGLASAEMARRLVALQRQRLIESQVVDQSTRKVLHDEVLPTLHATILELSQELSVGNGSMRNAVSHLTDVHRRIADLMQKMPTASTSDVAQLGLVVALKQALEKELGAPFEKIQLEVDSETEHRAKGISKLAAEVVFGAAREAIRNAAKHGRGAHLDRSLNLRVSIVCDDDLRVIIDDDGIGLGAGVPPSHGSGQGLSLHSTMMAIIGGSLTAERLPIGGTRVVLSLSAEQAKWLLRRTQT
jgi:signal transduction histidine kinase